MSVKLRENICDHCLKCRLPQIWVGQRRSKWSWIYEHAAYFDSFFANFSMYCVSKLFVNEMPCAPELKIVGIKSSNLDRMWPRYLFINLTSSYKPNAIIRKRQDRSELEGGPITDMWSTDFFRGRDVKSCNSACVSGGVFEARFLNLTWSLGNEVNQFPIYTSLRSTLINIGVCF